MSRHQVAIMMGMGKLDGAAAAEIPPVRAAICASTTRGDEAGPLCGAGAPAQGGRIGHGGWPGPPSPVLHAGAAPPPAPAEPEPGRTSDSDAAFFCALASSLAAFASTAEAFLPAAFALAIAVAVYVN